MQQDIVNRHILSVFQCIITTYTKWRKEIYPCKGFFERREKKKHFGFTAFFFHETHNYSWYMQTCIYVQTYTSTLLFLSGTTQSYIFRIDDHEFLAVSRQSEMDFSESFWKPFFHHDKYPFLAIKVSVYLK